jgi:hypothetical protein
MITLRLILAQSDKGYPMLRRFVFALSLMLVGLAAPVVAQDRAASDLFDKLGLPEIITVMRDEGLRYGDTIATDMLPSGPSPRWSARLDTIYDVDAMTKAMRDAFVTAMAGRDIAAITEFYDSDLGRDIVALEISARRAMLDDDVDAAAKDMAAKALADPDARVDLVTDFIAAGDLIEANVVGGLNSNYAFMMGLLDGGAVLPGVTADLALAEVWSQEQEIRQSTTEWLYAFLLMAYAPLSDEDMAAFTAFTRTDAGQDLTQGLFVAFDVMFATISRDLGLAASGFMVSQDL